VPAAVRTDGIGKNEDPEEMSIHFPGRVGGESAEAGRRGDRFVVGPAVVPRAVRRREDVKQVVDEFLVLSGAEGVEAGHVPSAVVIRDTKDHGLGPVLRVTPAGWQRFTAGLRTGPAIG
jgi:hypothetical protein